ncbi:hypothetical protein [Parabacteroides sp. AM08-6]|uniref:hypothetical protein n=1 Tax=Parabacteroides sp. AM08-6 TaxID=2292053 RepID=UPI000EFFFF09|nr:hypothetical protein [Parabacteroides sp. AM08-6]RHJ83546.1 hypothetical protein DW103_07425 [Parabacteroides sp. AM08-6]
MLTGKQYEIADKILNAINQFGGRCNMDQFYKALPDYDNHTMDYEYMKEMLMKQFHAIEYMGEDEYWLMMTGEGQNIISTGLKEYQQKSANKEELENTKLKLDVTNGWASLFKFAWWVLAAITGAVVDSLVGNPIGKLIHRLIE